jgi:hypothetical protein
VSEDLRETLKRRADEGYDLVRFYGDCCDTCGTQSHASTLSLSTLLAQDTEAAPQFVERERAISACRQSFDRGWAAAEAYQDATTRLRGDATTTEGETK